MTLNAQTPCPACPIVWRALYAAAQVLVAHLERQGAGQELWEARERVRIALQHVTPLVEAHLENQDHAMSVELVDARHLPGPTTLVLDRGLPFSQPGDSER